MAEDVSLRVYFPKAAVLRLSTKVAAVRHLSYCMTRSPNTFIQVQLNFLGYIAFYRYAGQSKVCVNKKPLLDLHFLKSLPQTGKKNNISLDQKQKLFQSKPTVMCFP